MAQSDPGDEQPLEQDDYWRVRYTFAKRAGLDKSHARAFATSRTPMSDLRDLLESGCPVRLAERILAPLT